MLFGSIFGTIQPPTGNSVGSFSASLMGLSHFIRNIIILLFIVAGLYAFFNFIIAGFEFISAGGDSSKISKAWGKIWQSILGLVIMIAAFALAAIIGSVLFNSWKFILQPNIPSPSSQAPQSNNTQSLTPELYYGPTYTPAPTLHVSHVIPSSTPIPTLPPPTQTPTPVPTIKPNVPLL